MREVHHLHNALPPPLWERLGGRDPRTPGAKEDGTSPRFTERPA
jgi:hypothetical protein